MVLCLGRNPIKHQSSTQKARALSSMEAEYYALLRATCQAIGLSNMMRDIGVELSITVNCDNQSAVDFTKRQGLSKTKHMSTALLWLQDAVEQNVVAIKKVHTDCNLADIMTKNLLPNKRNYFLEKMNFFCFSGQHELALRA